MIQERSGQAIRRLLDHNDNVADYIPAGLPDDFQEMLLDELREFTGRTRQLVFNEVNEFKQMCLDLLEATARDDVVVNDHWAELIRDIHSAVVPAPPPRESRRPRAPIQT
jgi:hypothetical protein